MEGKGKILITGGTGLVGSALTELLLKEGYQVGILSRKPGIKGKVVLYQWDIDKGYINPEAFKDVHAIIHLAGAGVADHRWTDAYKKEILDSRINSTRLLGEYLKKFPVPHVIAASAVGYYGSCGNEWLSEEHAAGNSFLADVCKQWEQEISAISSTGSRVAWIRIGIVLSTKGGALPVMDKPVRFGVGAYLGDGKQYTPWIHIEDLCRMFIYVMENDGLTGPFNGCAPEPLTNKDFIKTVAKALGRPFIPAPGPAFALKLMLGEQADMVLMSNRTSAKKIIDKGFRFHFTDAVAALKDLYATGR
jgi:uncharacterized protein (TIGR01777 family)